MRLQSCTAILVDVMVGVSVNRCFVFRKVSLKVKDKKFACHVSISRSSQRCVAGVVHSAVVGCRC